MDKETLKEYEQACAIIQETRERIDRMRMDGSDKVQQSVKASGGFPYMNKTIHLTPPSKAAKRESHILKWQIARAEEIKAAVERNMQEAPLRIQRIIQIKYLDGETWEETAKRIGGSATPESVRKEIERFLKNS